MATTELGRALRRWRDRVAPRSAGLPEGGRRRAAGLRREELAMLAGISVDYIVRLEQGRASSPSSQVVEALARALRLDPDERAHLFLLAGLAPPGPETVPCYLTPSVQRLLDRLVDTPVVVLDAAMTLLVANRMYAALMGDPSGQRGFARNRVWNHFLGPPGRVRHTPKERREFETSLVSELRSVVPLPGRPAAARTDRRTAGAQRPVRRAVGLGRGGPCGVLRQDDRPPRRGPADAGL